MADQWKAPRATETRASLRIVVVRRALMHSVRISIHHVCREGRRASGGFALRSHNLIKIFMPNLNNDFEDPLLEGKSEIYSVGDKSGDRDCHSEYLYCPGATSTTRMLICRATKCEV
ncbi:hypothetical protein CEXT_384911 [Caerostris extrusa]|uniref:Uncharacterized protein n=1 Tax=Caerostris extrusa TaxID=172846 RepID=A0AAV4QW55_CAEEX|nr:hypothetical protein CEXT_384911 [Caerostris extrusa]